MRCEKKKSKEIKELEKKAKKAKKVLAKRKKMCHKGGTANAGVAQG